MIRLEAMSTDDFSKVLEWNQNTAPEFLMQWAGPAFVYPLTVEQLISYSAQGENKRDPERFLYRIIESGSEETIGMIELGRIDYTNKSGRIGKFLIGESSARGKGIGQSVLNLLITFGFEELGLQRITLGVFDFNLSAILCYEKAGFCKEALLRGARKVGDAYWNLYEMSIQKEDWRKN